MRAPPGAVSSRDQWVSSAEIVDIRLPAKPDKGLAGFTLCLSPGRRLSRVPPLQTQQIARKANPSGTQDSGQNMRLAKFV